MMAMNHRSGIMIFTLGGLAGAIFYLPFKKVKNWAWESYWLIYAVVRPDRRAVGPGPTNLPERDGRPAASPPKRSVLLLCGASGGSAA